MTTPALELDGIDVFYGYAKALQRVSLSVAPGEVVALLGDNGAGKSTLLKVISGAQRPTSGEMRVHGEPVSMHSPAEAAAAGIQTVYQDLALVDAQDIATNLNLGREPLAPFPLSLLGVVSQRALRRESRRELDLLGVKMPTVTRPVEMLSGGQRQTVAIARAAVRVTGVQNGILLLDEPTAALGHEQTLLVEELIGSMAARGIAVVIVTHNLPLAMAASHRVIVLNRGRKVADVAKQDTDLDEVVAWITGAKGAMDDDRMDAA